MKDFIEKFKHLDNKQKMILTGIGAAIVLLVVAGITYAYYTAVVTNVNNTNTIIQTKQLSITFEGTQEITASNIIPGWTAQKRFTVENTSNSNMTFDINFTQVTNTFVGSDLKYSLSASYVQGENNKTYGTTSGFGTSGAQVQMVSSGTQSNLSISATTVPTTTEKVVTIYIPARAKILFTMPFEFVNNPNTSQNDDQGKTFNATIAISTNAAEAPIVEIPANSVGYTPPVGQSARGCTTVDCSMNELYDDIMGS